MVELASSASGQTRRFDCVPVTSGLHPTPDMALHRNKRREVPQPDVVPLFELFDVGLQITCAVAGE